MQRAYLAITCAILVCCAQTQPEDEPTAIRKAERFTTIAVVEQRFERAYTMLSPEERTRTSREDLARDIRSQHSGGFPTDVRATEYSLVPEHDGVMVYLVGELGSGRLYYQVAMQRTGGRYYPSGLHASKEPFPGSRRPRHPVGG